ncbi:ABC transporter permease [Vibrio mimicus]|uniref:ABC transporter permease n=1 Tax=Vibrio mimicus TaxID=674 RepID=UPI0001BACC44|nr:ABC transporter permease [Vibrio mimicus]EEY46424.1 O-antigen export system permease protein RfbD [Vibrio mimicus VM223]
MFPSKENLQLFRTMLRREVKAKYQGTLLGFLWNLVTPLMMLAIYSTVFLTVFKAKWHLSATEQADYGLMLFVGILTHTYMAEVLTTTSNVIRNNSNLVKKVRFPVAMLPMISVCSAGVNYLFGLILAFAYGAVSHYIADYSYLIYLPFVLLIYVMTLTAIAYLVSALGLFIRDVAQMMPVLITVLLFTSTVFFSAQSAPEELAKVLYLNPISPIADAIRSILYGQMPNLPQLLILGLISMVCGWVTYKFFVRLRPSFSDIL